MTVSPQSSGRPTPCKDVVKSGNMGDTGGVLVSLSVPPAPRSPGDQPTNPPPVVAPEPSTDNPPAKSALFAPESAAALQSAVRGALRRAGYRARARDALAQRIVRVLDLTAQGGKWLEIEHTVGLPWIRFRSALRSPALMDLYMQARDCGASLRQIAREEEIERRAFDGVDKPVYQGGRKVGVVREFSDRLAEFIVSANDPRKYGKQATGAGGSGGPGIIFNITGVVLGQQKPAESATKTLPGEAIEPKPQQIEGNGEDSQSPSGGGSAK